MGTFLSRASITGLPFLLTLGVVTAAVIGLRFAIHRRLVRRVLTAAAIVLGLLASSAGVNAYFDYVPTIGALVGRRAADQSTWVAARDAPTMHQPRHGRVVVVDIPPAVSGFRARRAQVYLPPAWFTTPRPRLPVIELLHGTPGTPYDWTRSAVGDVVGDSWAATHGGVAPILVMPDENGSFFADTECVNGRGGNSETYLTVDVRQWVVNHLGTASDRAHWAVGGASEGGYCALTLALRHPHLYSTFFDVGGLDRATHHGNAARLFTGPPATVRRALRYHDARWLLTHRRGRAGLPLAGWFEAGGADGKTTKTVVSIAGLARREGVTTTLTVDPGAHHTWRMFRAAFRHAYPWLAVRLGTGADPRA